MKAFGSILNRFNKNSNIIALQDASISLVPMLLAVTLSLMLAEGLAYMAPSLVADILYSIHTYFYIFFPLIFTISLSIAFAKSHDVDVNCLVLLSSSLILLLVIDDVETITGIKQSTYFKILPIPLCLITAKLFKYFSARSRLHLFKTDDMSLHIKKNFNNILPSLLTFISVLLLFLLIESIWQTYTDFGTANDSRISNTDNLIHAVLLKFLYKLTWFIGVNPSHMFSFLQAPYHEAFAENQMAFQNAQEVPHVIASGFYYFSDMGGAGSVWCLILAVLLFSKSKHHKRVAKLSVLPCTFNISEIIHYGLPIVFNPFLFVPFVLVPVVLFLNTYFFISIGLVSPLVSSVPWTTPLFLNAYLATGGDFSAVLLQLLNLGIGTVIYLKFLRMLEASHLNNDAVSKFSDKFDLETKNIQALQYRNQQSLMQNLDFDNQVNTALLQIAEGELLLYYQPIVCSQSNRIVKIEALIRLKDADGLIHPPDFIEILSKAGLSTDIDRWVIQRVVKQSHQWPDTFNDVDISINISPASLISSEFTDYLIKLQQQSKHGLFIEILENQAVFEEQKINMHLKRLKENQISVLLDDFGSGYSALSMLSKLNIDGVKYDINFAELLDSEQGHQLLTSCLKVSHTLKHLTVLEGIETARQFELAINSGVNLLQGFYISKPLQPNELVTFIESRNHQGQVK